MNRYKKTMVAIDKRAKILSHAIHQLMAQVNSESKIKIVVF